MAEPGHEPEADLRSSPPPWNATAVAPDAFDALLQQLASVHRMELGRASEEAKHLSKEIEVLSKENRVLKNSVAARSGGCGSLVMETGKVPAENNKNNSPMEQQAEKQDAFSKERGEQDKKIDEMMLEIDINMELERQEKGHDGQTGKVPADTSPMEQQAGEQDAVSKERGEQDETVDEMQLKFDIMQPERQENGHDGQIKVDEQEVPAGQADEHRWTPNAPTFFPLRSDLSFGIIGVMPAGPSSHVAEGPSFTLPGVSFNSPPLINEKRPRPRPDFFRAKSLSMLEPTPRRRSSSSFVFPLELQSPSAKSGLMSRRPSHASLLRSQSPPSGASPRDAPGTPKSFSRASSSAYLA
ncbi:unnamed protein product, partial [Polarella glacialis]